MNRLIVVVLYLIVAACNVSHAAPAHAVESRRASPRADQSEALQKLLENAPPEFGDQFLLRHPATNYIAKRPGHYTAADWHDVIDSTWGPGLPWAEKKSLFESLRDTINVKYACFRAVDTLAWDSVWNLYYDVVLDTVSQGRFSGLMSHATRLLFESHTNAYDAEVAFTDLAPGVPLMIFGGWGVNDHFGAGLTPRPDSSLLVYRAAPAHPLGLVPGDVVLGYDRRRWPELYRELTAAQVPVAIDWWWGSSESSYAHSWLMSAGMNWHLFDTIDVVRNATGDTLHLATAALAGQTMSLWATEQLDVPGVTMPDPQMGQLVSWGVIDGTRIGYIYVIGWWSSTVIDEWRDAVQALAVDSFTTAIIVDTRTNFGGWDPWAHPGLDILFETTVETVNWATRCNTDERLAMCPGNAEFDSLSTIFGDPATFYGKPIAVLVGPGCVSAGDQVSLALAFHPMTKFFGKPTAAAFNDPYWLMPHDDFEWRVADDEAFLAANPDQFLTHDEFPGAADFPWVDYEEVWLTRDGVAAGTDDVVEAAKAWFLTQDADQDGVVDTLDNCVLLFNPGQEDGNSNGIGDACEGCAVVNTGDMNGDTVITTADIILVVDFVFRGGPTPSPCEAVADVNCDAAVASADIVYLVNRVFRGGPDPCDVCTLVPHTWLCP